MYNIDEIRKDFPILNRAIHGKPNTFLDSAASAQKPQVVIDAICQAYHNIYANVHRGSYLLSEESTVAYDSARKIVQKFLNTKSENEIVFTSNATESINLVASTGGRKHLQKGDEVLISQAEHHANLVPWQMLRDELGFTLNIFNIADDGSYLQEEFLKKLNFQTKLVAVTGMSNVLGTVFPIKDIIASAHQVGALCL